MSDLTWKVSGYTSDCGDANWVRMEPLSGTSTFNAATIYIDKAICPGDCNRASIVLSASTGSFTEIPITRCVPECNCESIGFNAISSDNLPYSADTITIGTYESMCYDCISHIGFQVDNEILTDVNLVERSITAKITENTSTNARTSVFYLTFKNGDDEEICAEGSVIQNGRDLTPCEEAALNCNNVVISGSTQNVIWQGDDISYTISGKTIGGQDTSSCWEITGYQITSGSSDWISVDSGNSIITVYEYSSETQGPDVREGEITFTLRNEEGDVTCNKVFSFKQQKPNMPCVIDFSPYTSSECIVCDCGCEKLKLINTQLTIPSTGCIEQPIGSLAECISGVTFDTYPEALWVDIHSLDETIYLTIGNNAGDERITDVTLSYKSTCDSVNECQKTLKITQKGDNTCNCDYFLIQGIPE